MENQTQQKQQQQKQLFHETITEQQQQAAKSSSSSLCCSVINKTVQGQKLLADIRKGVKLRHVSPSAKQLSNKQPLGETSKKLDGSKCTEKHFKAQQNERLDIEKILLQAMMKRRPLMRYSLESSSSDDKDESDRDDQQWDIY